MTIKVVVLEIKYNINILRVLCKTIVTTLFYVTTYNNFAPSPNVESGSYVCLLVHSNSVLVNV